jgi:hypothetical protein
MPIYVVSGISFPVITSLMGFIYQKTKNTNSKTFIKNLSTKDANDLVVKSLFLMSFCSSVNVIRILK